MSPLPGHLVIILIWKRNKKEFLLKFDKDRERYLWWLFEAKKSYHVCFLDYAVTSNRNHLLVVDNREQAIPNL